MATDGIPAMTRDQLDAWAVSLGKVLVDRDEHEHMCAKIAAAAAAETDLDTEFQVLFGDG